MSYNGTPHYCGVPLFSLYEARTESKLYRRQRLLAETRHDIRRTTWIWRVSRHVVTHNHQRPTFELLLADARKHFQTLTHTPADVFRHIGSPFALEKHATQPRDHAA